MKKVKTIKDEEIVEKIDRVNISPIYYKINFVDTRPLDTKNFGEVDFENSCINISSRLEQTFMQYILMHEITHCFFKTSGIEELISNEHEETIISSLSFSFLRFIKDNKKLVQTLIKEEGE